MRILLCGATGAMGHVITDICRQNNEWEIVAGIGRGKENLPYPIFSNFSDINIAADIVIDFSTPAITKQLLSFCQKEKLPLVLATTGHDTKTIEYIKTTSQYVPLLYSQNTSLGIHALRKATVLLQQMLEGFDIEIIEAHHRHKADAPSGTAKMIFSSLQEQNPSLTPCHDRHTQNTARKDNTVGISTIRGGSIVGEHTVLFAGTDEQLEIRHTALSKSIFARGALKCADWLLKKEARLYTMDDLFTERS